MIYVPKDTVEIRSEKWKKIRRYYENNEILPSGIIVEKQNDLFAYNDICKITFQIRLNSVVS